MRAIRNAVVHGNGNIRTLLACCVLVAMFLYPLANM